MPGNPLTRARANSARTLLLLAALFLPAPAFACMWDSDTLLQERSRFPGTLELITGKFLRHSPEFYQWRIQDRLGRLDHDPDNPGLYDDLAVAYDKTGRHQQAVDVMLAKDRRWPGLYETEANLGTFYIHDGRLEEGLEHIGQALRINPDAHFGREKYQKLLVEYFLSRRRGGHTRLPLAEVDESGRPDLPTTFAAFLLGERQGENWQEGERQAAVRGVLGMMRFGQHDSPVLLEALATLLSSGRGEENPEDAKRLAARAYLKAAAAVEEAEAREAYRKLAGGVLRMQTRDNLPSLGVPQLPLAELEASFREELAEAQGWTERLWQEERTWIEQGKDPEQEFARKYATEPRVATHWAEGLPAVVEANPTAAGVVAVSALLAGALLLWRWRKGRRLAACRPPE